jgi:hypothetical protein
MTVFGRGSCNQPQEHLLPAVLLKVRLWIDSGHTCTEFLCQHLGRGCHYLAAPESRNSVSMCAKVRHAISYIFRAVKLMSFQALTYANPGVRTPLQSIIRGTHLKLDLHSLLLC